MSGPGPDFDTLLVRGAVGTLVVVALWLAAVVVAVAVEARTGGRSRFAERAGCPRVLRTWLLALFVAAFAGFAGIAPAQASDHASPRSAPGSTGVLDGLRLPDRPEIVSAGRVVVVRPGDTLWSIASGQLRRTHPAGSLPTASAVAAAVSRLHAVNRDVIGPDPDLIRPGQHLTISEET